MLQGLAVLKYSVETPGVQSAEMDSTKQVQGWLSFVRSFIHSELLCSSLKMSTQSLALIQFHSNRLKDSFNRSFIPLIE